MGIFNPTLPDIGKLTSSTTAQVSITLSAMGVASMIGAMLSGPLFDRYNGLLVLSCLLVLQGLTVGLAPWCPELTGFQLMAGFTCVFNYAILTGSFATNCLTWKSQPKLVAPVIQLTDMIHVLGIAITPQIVTPFIGRVSFLPDASISDLFNTTTMAMNITPTTVPEVDHSHIQPLQVAYLIIAVISGIAGVTCLGAYAVSVSVKINDYRDIDQLIRRRRCYSLNEGHLHSSRKAKIVSEERNKRAGSVERALTCKHVRIDVGLLKSPASRSSSADLTDRHGDNQGSLRVFSCNVIMGSILAAQVLFFTVVGSRETLLTGLLFTYVSQILSWQTLAGTLLVTFYQVTRVVIHGVIVVAAHWVSPLKLTIFNLTVLLVSAVLTMSVSVQMFTAGVILSGIATSNIIPTAITLARTSFQVNGKLMGFFVGAFAGGQCIISPIAGSLMESFPTLVLLLTVAAVLLFMPWMVTAKCCHADRSCSCLGVESGMTPDEIIVVTSRSSSCTSDELPNEKTPLIYR
jgi:MFS family permease